MYNLVLLKASLDWWDDCCDEYHSQNTTLLKKWDGEGCHNLKIKTNLILACQRPIMTFQDKKR